MLDKAYRIAVRCLRECYEKYGIYAGRKNFDDYWARDGFYATLGALELRDYEVIKKNFLLFIKHQRKNGQLPLRVTYFYLLAKIVFGWRIKGRLRPRYIEDKVQSYPRDQNSLFIISALEYVKRAKDYGFLKKYFKNFEMVLKWNFSNDPDKDLLMEESFYATWADSLRKRGKVLYTNVLNYKATLDFSGMCRILNKKEKQKEYYEIAQKIKRKINEIFWNGEYYIDWTDWKRENFFSADGNILAILYGVADKNKAKSIMRFIKKHKLEDFTLRTNFPKYGFWKIALSVRLGGVPDYHNGMRWLWLGCIDVLAKLKIGMKKEARSLLTKIAEKICEYDMVYEVYEKDGRPIYRFIYKSEAPFAWSSALYILAYEKLKNLGESR